MLLMISVFLFWIALTDNISKIDVEEYPVKKLSSQNDPFLSYPLLRVKYDEIGIDALTNHISVLKIPEIT